MVDVGGGGVGGFCIKLSHHHPRLTFIVQDRARPCSNRRRRACGRPRPRPPSPLGASSSSRTTSSGRTPTHGTDVFWLRYMSTIGRDGDCVRILENLKPVVAPPSRIPVCDQIMNTTLGCEGGNESAPWPLPANYGYYQRYSHQRDMAMMGIINGIERTPDQFRAIMELQESTWDRRGPVALIFGGPLKSATTSFVLKCSPHAGRVHRVADEFWCRVYVCDAH